MNALVKRPFLAAAMLFAVLSSGCASIDAVGDGRSTSGQPDSLVSQLEHDSQGK